MKLSEDYTAGSHIIQSYEDDNIVVNSKCFTKSFLVSNTSLNENWGIDNIEQTTHEHWHDIIKLKPEVILMGTGKKIVFPHPSTYAPAIEQGIGVRTIFYCLKTVLLLPVLFCNKQIIIKIQPN